MTESFQLSRMTTVGGAANGVVLHGASLDDPRFESIVLSLHAAIDVAGFWNAIQSILDEVVPNDACVVYLDCIDCSKALSASTILTTESVQKCHDLIQQRRNAALLLAFVLSHPGIKQYQLSDVEPDIQKLQRSEFFRSYMAPKGWHYTACLLFWQEDRLHSEIAIHRTTEQGDFTSREIEILKRLHPHLETTLRRLSAVEQFASDRAQYSAERNSVEAVRRSFNRLTPAEGVIVSLVREGCSNKEIATRLEKSIRTVKTQLTSIYKKFEVRSRSRLLARMS